jgi:hypothetical protein
MMHKYGNRTFYGVVLAVSLAGASQAASGWLGWWIGFSAVAVGAVELGGVVLSVHADHRRRIGERAIPARLLSAAVAIGAVSVNYFGHASTGPAVFFAGMSGLGYTVWLIDSAAKRRDALRTAGKLEGTAPAYGVLAWLRRPLLTARARELALATPELGKIGSVMAAQAAMRADRRTRAIEKSLRTRIANHVDPTMAKIATNTFNMNEVATRLRDGADYDGLSALLAAELLPSRLHKPTEPIKAEVAAQPVVAPVVAIESAPAPAIAARPRKSRAQWDAHDVVRMILDGKTLKSAEVKACGISPASWGRLVKVTKMIKANPNIAIRRAEKVPDSVIQFIRSEIAR